jgi:hypothetical protein
MNRKPVFAAVLVLVAPAVSAQPLLRAAGSRTGLEMAMSRDAAAADGSAVRIVVDFSAAGRKMTRGGFSLSAADSATSAASLPSHLRLDVVTDVRTAGSSWSIDGQNAIALWTAKPAASTSETSDIDWVGLLSEQVRIDAMMHFKRMTEPKTRAEVEHSSYYGGYAEAVKGYFTTGLRWNDGDNFVNNNINHPLMGAVSSHVYTNNDRRCRNLAYGESRYWACIGRATAYSALASVNWEWNPLMSESALGHVGRSHICANGKCTGEGGWTDFVMTPLGGAGMRIAGDIARAKLWPVLDEHLSGNIAARILKNIVKVATDPSGIMNSACNMNFNGMLSSRTAGSRW